MIIQPHKTAMPRTKASRPCLFLLKKIGMYSDTLLDYGCGYGADCDWLGATGYDPYYRPTKPQGTFEVVMCNYVLNVLPTREEREELVRAAWNYVADRGYLFFAVRLANEIKAKAVAGNWETHGDGFVTAKGTFQHGMTNEEVFEVVDTALTPVLGDLSEWNYEEICPEEGEGTQPFAWCLIQKYKT